MLPRKEEQCFKLTALHCLLCPGPGRVQQSIAVSQFMVKDNHPNSILTGVLATGDTEREA